MPVEVVDGKLHPVEPLFPWPDQRSACELLGVRKTHMTATLQYSPVVIAVKPSRTNFGCLVQVLAAFSRRLAD